MHGFFQMRSFGKLAQDGAEKANEVPRGVAPSVRIKGAVTADSPSFEKGGQHGIADEKLAG